MFAEGSKGEFIACCGKIRSGHSTITVSRVAKGALSYLGREKFFAEYRIAIPRHRMLPIVFYGCYVRVGQLSLGLLVLALAIEKGRE